MVALKRFCVEAAGGEWWVRDRWRRVETTHWSTRRRARIAAYLLNKRVSKFTRRHQPWEVLPSLTVEVNYREKESFS